MITKYQLLEKYKEVEIAELLGITRGAVNQWNLEAPIDLKYEYILRHEKDSELWLKYNPIKVNK